MSAGERLKVLRNGKHKSRSSARTGVHKVTTRRVMDFLGWEWTPLTDIGTGCTVHLRDGELPTGTIIVKLSGHIAAVIDGCLQYLEDCSRRGTRCVYGFWRKTAPKVVAMQRANWGSMPLYSWTCLQTHAILRIGNA